MKLPQTDTTSQHTHNRLALYDDHSIRYKLATRVGTISAATGWACSEFLSLHRFATDPWVSNVGRAMPRYRGQSSVTWQRHRWGATLGMTYIHPYGDFVRDGWEVKRYSTYASSLSYALPDHRLLRNARLTVGLENMFNHEPPIDPSGGAAGYNQGLIGRPGGRFGFIEFRESR